MSDHFDSSLHYGRVKLLNELIDKKYVPDKVTMPDRKTRELKARLIMEEALETVRGLGFLVDHREDYPDAGTVRIDNIEFCDYGNEQREVFVTGIQPDMEAIADGCADLSVVTMGALIACGIPDKELLRIVDENNLQKFGPGSYRREDGKLIKPPDHKPPDIKGLLAKLGWREE